MGRGSNDGEEYLDAVRAESIDELGYFLRPSELFDAIAAKGAQKGNNFILDDLSRILTNIQKSTMGTESEEDFDHLFEDMDLGSTKLGRSVADRNDLVAKVLVHLQRLDFHLHDVNSDVLGDAYEYLIGQFASGAGKKAGEFYTPQQVSEILAQIVTTGKDRLQNIYDPTCGSGSLLLRVARKIGHRNVGGFFGQELNRTTYNLARMNMILHGVHYRKFDLKQEDTLERPQHDGMTFEAVVANPPFSANWSANPQFTTDDRFSTFGGLPPESKADYAFVLHMIHHLAENGTMAVILPHGALFRGGREGAIRKILIAERNYLDAVIGLPANIFFGTSIPTCIMVFKKCRENQEDVLFIDASGSDHFEKVKNQNILRDRDVDKIIAAYRNRTSEDGYSYVAPMHEIEENEYNLNIPRFIDIFGEEPTIRIDAVIDELSEVEHRAAIADLRVADFCKELKIPPPAGNNISLLQTYKKGIMQAIFSQKIRFKKDDDTNFPDWQERLLGSVFDWISTNSLSREMLTAEHGAVQNIHYGDIHGKFSARFVQSSASAPFIKPHALPKPIRDELFCQPGDLVIADASEDYADIGKTIEIIEVAPHSLVAGLHTHLARPKVGQLVVGYSGYLFQTWALRKQIMRIAQGISVLGISKPNLAQLKLPVPHPDEQRKIADFLSALDDKITAMSAQVDQMQAFKSGLLQQLSV
jgi:type I restriction system adenine methylase HsdM